MSDGAMIPSVLARYDLTPPIQVAPAHAQGVNNLHLIVAAGHRRLRIKVYAPDHPPATLRYEHDLLHTLAGAGLPFSLPVPLADRAGATLQPGPDGWLALLPNLPGAPLDPADLAQVRALGEALGALHVALADLPLTPRPGRALFQAFVAFPPPARDPRRLTPAAIGAPDTAANCALLAWLRATSERLADFVVGPYQALPQQLCHNDIAPYNVLTAGGRVTALLDFEFAGPAPRGLDLAMALRMTMRAWVNPDPWPTARALLAGYAAGGGRLSADEAALLPELFLLRSAMGVFWALGRARPLDQARLLEHIGFLRNTARWLDQHGSRLVDLTAECVTR